MVSEINIKPDQLFNLPAHGQDRIFYEKLASIAFAYALGGEDIPSVSVVKNEPDKFYVVDYHRTTAQLLINGKVNAIVDQDTDLSRCPGPRSPFSVRVDRTPGSLKLARDDKFRPYEDIPPDFLRDLDARISEANFLT